MDDVSRYQHVALRDHDVIYTLRSVHQGQIHMLVLADQKANILIGVLAIIATILFSKINFEPDLNDPRHWALLVFLVLEMTGVLFALLVILPQNVGPRRRQSLESPNNPLFFGVFTGFRQEEFLDYLERNVMNDQGARRAIAVDIYQMGRVLNRKYRLLRFAYLFSAIGVVTAAGMAMALDAMTLFTA